MRLTALATVTATALAALALTGPAFADDHRDLVRKTSAHSVKDTMDRLEAAIEAAGARVFARINHAEGAANAGMTLRPTTLLLFGNPAIGTPMMQANQEMGLELPLKVLAYRDAEGTVHVVYEDIRLLAASYEVDVPTVAKARGALDKLTDKAVSAD